MMAVAVSNKAWYSWTSQYLFDKNPKDKNDIQLLAPYENIGEGDNISKLIIGHNVGYDRARIKEQYYPNSTTTRFLDTMSMHIATCGFSGDQRIKSKSATHKESKWMRAGSLNSLDEVHNFYCGTRLEKLPRDIFVSGKMKDIHENYHFLMEYCAKDVLATYNVLVKLTPMFFQRLPHSVTFSGMLEMGQMYLPLNKNWKRYIRACKNEYENVNQELKVHLVNIANDACHLLKNKLYEKDKWMRNLEWETKSFRFLKSTRKDWVQPKVSDKKITSYFSEIYQYTDKEKMALGKLSTKDDPLKTPIMDGLQMTGNILPKIIPHMPGIPIWFSSLCEKEDGFENWSPGATLLSPLTRTTPRLLRLTWLGHPVHHDINTGWGYLRPADDAAASINVTELLEEIEEDVNNSVSNFSHPPSETIQNPLDGYTFHRLPHKDGLEKNVGNPLSKPFLEYIENGILSSADSSNALRCLEINKSCSYWRATKNRILEQMIVDLNEDVLPPSITNHEYYNDDLNCGAIVPQAAVCGTVSRRAVERTWLTASNIQNDRIGSELKAMIQAPPGYCFVGADVDSQELWIASLLGDASSVNEHGCTPLSWMTLQGDKLSGTDLHSKTAAAIGTTRNTAKVFNYARMYGAGKQSSMRLLMQNNKSLTKGECVKKVNTLYEMTKGKLLYELSLEAQWFVKKAYVRLSENTKQTGYATYAEILKIQKAAEYEFGYQRHVLRKDLIECVRWHGGIESHMFNKLQDIAQSDLPATPILGCQISKALEKGFTGKDFELTKMNWVVQSSAVDYLHLLLVSMRWLIDKYNLKARFMFSIHDEIRYISTMEDRYKVCLALQIANLWTRSMFSYQLGMHDLPLSVGFFSTVEVDSVLRKEAGDDCITPSNPLGLNKQYGIPHGETLDINQILEKTNGGSLE